MKYFRPSLEVKPFIVCVLCVSKAGAAEDDVMTRSALKALEKLQEEAKAADGMPLK